MSTLFDPGLQPERTELAWRRTCLAFGVGSLIALRLLSAALGSAWWVAVGVAGLAASGVMWLWARRRYRAVNTILERDGERGRMGALACSSHLASSHKPRAFLASES